jgi:hypothetical protein
MMDVELPENVGVTRKEFLNRFHGMGSKKRRERQRMLFVLEIIQCARNGLRELMFVVGNDDDLSEIELVPIEEDPVLRSPREGCGSGG